MISKSAPKEKRNTKDNFVRSKRKEKNLSSLSLSKVRERNITITNEKELPIDLTVKKWDARSRDSMLCMTMPMAEEMFGSMRTVSGSFVKPLFPMSSLSRSSFLIQIKSRTLLMSLVHISRYLLHWFEEYSN